MAERFIIYALPRSRTAWLSHFLSYGGWHCGHDQARFFRNLDDIKSWLAMERTGTVETAAAPFWRTTKEFSPGIKVVTLRRPVDDVVASFDRLGMPGRRATVERLDRKLDQIEARVPGVLSVTFDDLATEEGCAKVFEHCLSLPFDRAWWKSWAAVNAQIDMASLIRYVRANGAQLSKLVEVVRQHEKCRLSSRPLAEDAGMSLQAEPFDAWYRDGVDLFREHGVRAGYRPDAWRAMINVPVSKTLEAAGNMQIVTARSNGKMFGYLMTIIAPSMEMTGETTAIHAAFFTSPDVKGLGLKLHRKSSELLRARGVDELFCRAGPRSEGPRLGAIYRRLGALPEGELFRISLKGA